MRELTEQDIDYISVGASVLGSGGGGRVSIILCTFENPSLYEMLT